MIAFKLPTLAVLASAGLLAGCASATFAPVNVPSRHQAEEGSGALILSMTNNSGLVAQAQSITLARTDLPAGSKPSYATLPQVTAGLARDTSLFVATLPAGKYRVESVSYGGYSLTLSEKGRDLLGNIEIVSGKVCDFGRLVTTPTEARSAVVGRSRIHTDNRQLANRFSPANATVYNLPANPECGGVISERDTIEAFALSRPVGIQSLTETDEGDLVVASRLGTLFIKPKGRGWYAAQSGSLETLMWANQRRNGNGSLLAVGEFNTLLEFGRDGKLRRMDTGNLPAGNLLFIDGQDGKGWFVVLQVHDKVGIYTTEKLEAPDWRLVENVEVGHNFWRGFMHFWAWSTRHGFAYASTTGGIHLYDFETSRWSQPAIPDRANLTGVSYSANDTIGILTSPGGGFGGVFAHTYVSSDLGKSWSMNKPPFSVQIAAPLRTESGAVLEIGGVFGNSGLYGLSPSTGQWESLNKDLRQDTVLRHTPTQGLYRVLNAAAFSQLERSTDDGRTWRLVFDNERVKGMASQAAVPPQPMPVRPPVVQALPSAMPAPVPVPVVAPAAAPTSIASNDDVLAIALVQAGKMGCENKGAAQLDSTPNGLIVRVRCLDGGKLVLRCVNGACSGV